VLLLLLLPVRGEANEAEPALRRLAGAEASQLRPEGLHRVVVAEAREAVEGRTRRT